MAQSRLGNGDELLMFSGRGNHREMWQIMAVYRQHKATMVKPKWKVVLSLIGADWWRSIGRRVKSPGLGIWVRHAS